MNSHDKAERFAVMAVSAMRKEGISPRGVLRAFEQDWTGRGEPSWDDVVNSVARAGLSVGRPKATVRRRAAA